MTGSGPQGGRCAVAVMAKNPEAGRSKTRLCPPLTPDQAAALSAAFLRDTTDNLACAARAAPIVPYAAYAPAGAEAALARHLAPGTALLLADGGQPCPDGVEGFGRCLLQAVEGMLGAGHDAACVLSSDTPTLPTRLLVQAAEALLETDGQVVLGACDDGGYYLLGMRATHAALFSGIAWSTATVAEATRARARRLGLRVAELEPWTDIDDAASLAGLARHRAGYPAPATRAVLAAMAAATPGLLARRGPAPDRSREALA